MEYDGLLFAETQRFRQKWLWTILLVTNLLVVFLMGYGLYQQVFLGRPFGSNPSSDTALIVTTVLVILFVAGITWLFYRATLATEVRKDGLYVRYFPFHLSWRKIPLENLKACEAVTYSPLVDYGGWGIRWGRAGRAYNVYGNRGVRLTYDNGRSLLIGSQMADELAEAIRSLVSAHD